MGRPDNMDAPSAGESVRRGSPASRHTLTRSATKPEEDPMAEHTIGTREEWQAAREELAKLESEQAERNEEIKKKRRELPWVPVEKEYVFDTEDGRKTLADLFEGRSQLLAYNVMYGPDYELGACPGCPNLPE